MTWRVLISCPNLLATIDRYRALFSEHDIQIHIPEFTQQLSEDELLTIIHQFDGVIAGDDPYTAAVIQAADRLKVIAKWGVGMDNIDLDAAAARDIPVYNTPGAFSNEVADNAIGYLVLLSRKLHKIDQAVRKGVWLKPLGISLQGKVLGIVGLGNIGREVARRGYIMGMRMLGTDIVQTESSFHNQTGLVQVEISELLRQSDFIVLCCNLTPDNHHMLNHEAFDQMKDGVYLINVSRGPLIQEEALLAGLASAKVAGAALDVFETEPLPIDHPLQHYENCIFGSHNSSNTFEAVLRVNELTINNLLQGLGVAKRSSHAGPRR